MDLSPKACLSKIVDALEMQLDERSDFYDRQTGEVLTVSNELLAEAEDDGAGEMPHLPEWQHEEWEDALRVASKKGIVPLPSKFDVHEWQMMSDFANSLDAQQICAELQAAIHRAGAFRNFKEAIRRWNIENQWSAFRTEALRQIAIAWCEENDIGWE